MKFRGLPKYINCGLVALAIAGVLMLFYPNDAGLYSFKNLFLLTWIILAIIIAAYSIHDWRLTAKEFLHGKFYGRLFFHFGILLLIIWIMANVVWGLTQGIFHFAEPASHSKQNLINAKRAEPRAVEPFTYRGIKYIAPHFKMKNKQVQRGGFIEAWDIKTNKMLWDLKIYETKYDPKLEQDVQDVYITSLKIEHDKLLITNEWNEIYGLNLETKKVERIMRGSNMNAREGR